MSQTMKKLAMRKGFGLLLAAACFAGGETEAQWVEKIGIKITLVNGLTHTYRVPFDTEGIGKGWPDGLYWPNYDNENYKSIKIPAGLSKLEDISINKDTFTNPTGNHDALVTLESIDLPSYLHSLLSLSIRNAQLKAIRIPSGMTSLWSLTVDNCRLETIQFPDGKTSSGRMTKLNYLNFPNTQLETLVVPDGLTSLLVIDVKGSSRLDTIVFGKDTKDSVIVEAEGSGLRRIIIPRRLNGKVRIRPQDHGDRLSVAFLEDLNPEVEMVRRGGVLSVSWETGVLHASDKAEGGVWRVVGDAELSPLRIPAVLEGKMFFRLKPKE